MQRPVSQYSSLQLQFKIEIQRVPFQHNRLSLNFGWEVFSNVFERNNIHFFSDHQFIGKLDPPPPHPGYHVIDFAKVANELLQENVI